MSKRARLTDANDPLSSTDRVLAGFEQASNKLTSQEASKSESQQVNKLESQEVHEKIAIQDIKPSIAPVANEQVDKSASQEVNKLTIRKFTFQLDEALMKKLQTFYLQLQLQLGETAPYKEVIVEEAIARLLALKQENQQSLIEDLQTRQKSRR